MKPGGHAQDRPNHLKRRRFNSTARTGSCTDAFLGAAFRYHGLSGYRDLTTPGLLPSSGVVALLGFFPFAGLLPQPGGRAEHARRLNTQRDISAGPGPRAVRAAPFAPIDFRRGGPAPVKCV